MKLSLVIPCYNEAANLALLVPRCLAVMEAAGGPQVMEVVLVDNGSTDDSPAVLSHLITGNPGLISVRVERNQGYGFGILSGLRAASGDILAWTHADMQTDPMDAITGLKFFRDSACPELLFVKGRRYGRPLADQAFTAGMSAFETVLFSAPMADINAQPTMFHRACFDSWQDPPGDFALDLYAYATAIRSGLKVHRFPVAFGKRAHGSSHWNVNWQAKLKFIRRTMGFSLALRRRFSVH